MANILDEALAGKYKTMPVVYKKPVPPTVKNEILVETQLSKKKKILLSFAGLAIAGAAAVLVSKDDALNQFMEIGKNLVEKSKVVLNGSEDIKERSVALFDEATKTVKTVLKKLQLEIDDGRTVINDGDVARISFLDDTLCISEAEVKKVAGTYRVSTILKNSKYNPQRLIICDNNGGVSSVFNGISIVNGKSVLIPEVFVYDDNKIISYCKNFKMKKEDKGFSYFANEVYKFKGDLVSFIENVYCKDTNKKSSYANILDFKDKKLAKVTLGELFGENIDNATGTVLSFQENKLKNVITENFELPEWFQDLSLTLLSIWDS